MQTVTTFNIVVEIAMQRTLSAHQRKWGIIPSPKSGGPIPVLPAPTPMMLACVLLNMEFVQWHCCTLHKQHAIIPPRGYGACPLKILPSNS